ncbi:hypothetical protein M404DRAFT_509673 [Pisolithus tinctorius Marx 270]|uniref:Yeast cell wall synthesis Kre9/Knh1-like N-terminal domain-containing protein n=2 Tax=Pisolithus tinctorius Marx 270 TaxID=870435 RepID=A0A0C3ND20_PISTI|nr:hypothetical protein M404DRAFT_509673 [Pisolithus tinctorius Marx 270]
MFYPHRRSPNRASQPAFIIVLFGFLSYLASVHAYFIINQPGASTSWAVGSPYPVTWTKGLQDGVDTFDVELMRLYEDGLYLVAKSGSAVPTTYSTLNILLQDVPAGDDYFLLCLNSTDGVTFGISSRFTVSNSSSSSNPSPDPSVPTVTVSGTPDPLKVFATTLGPASNGAHGLLYGNEPGIWGVLVMMGAAVLSGVWTLW